MGMKTKAEQAKQFQQFLSECVLDLTLSIIAALGDRRHSLREIQDKYGQPCARLFSMVFIQWQRGGCSKTGKPFKTCWRCDEGRAGLLRDALRATKHLQDRTAHDVMQAMGNPEALVRVKLPGAAPQVLSGEALKAARVVRSRLLADLRLEITAKYSKDASTEPQVAA